MLANWRAYRPTNSKTPSAVRTPPTEACTAAGPAGAASGIRIVTWYNPAHPVVSTVLTTSAATPPTVTVGAVIVTGAPLASSARPEDPSSPSLPRNVE